MNKLISGRWTVAVICGLTALTGFGGQSAESRYKPRGRYGLVEINLTPDLGALRRLPAGGLTPQFKSDFSKSLNALAKGTVMLYSKKIEGLVSNDSGIASGSGVGDSKRMAINVFIQVTQRTFGYADALDRHMRSLFRQQGYSWTNINALNYPRARGQSRVTAKGGRHTPLTRKYPAICADLRKKSIRWLIIGFVAGTRADLNMSTKLIDTARCETLLHAGGHVIEGRFAKWPSRQFRAGYMR